MGANSAVPAAIISLDDEARPTSLPLDGDSRLIKLQQLVGGFIETLCLPDNRCIVFNEEGKRGFHGINRAATAIAHEAQMILPGDYIPGIAVILPAEAL